MSRQMDDGSPILQEAVARHLFESATSHARPHHLLAARGRVVQTTSHLSALAFETTMRLPRTEESSHPGHARIVSTDHLGGGVPQPITSHAGHAYGAGTSLPQSR